MKNKYLLILLMLCNLNLSAQNLISFGVFPTEIQTNEPIKTTELLSSMNWEKIQEFASTNSQYIAEEAVDGKTNSYSYYNLKTDERFYIESYDGFVYEFFSEMPQGSRPTSTSYFDKNIFEKYIDYKLPELSKEFKISIEEPIEIIQYYYNILRSDNNNDYGFICEYGTIGLAPYKRKLIIKLLKNRRIDLLKKLMYSSNIQAQVYAIDALIYNDIKNKKELEINEQKMQEYRNQIENIDSDEEGQIGKLEFQIDQLWFKNEDMREYEPLNEKDWEYIYQLRDSGREVITCGNSGSFKKYNTDVSELLSEKAINKIPDLYEMLEMFGYFR